MNERKEVFQFENITVDVPDFRVTRDAEPVVLTPRAFDVLLVLIKNAGHVVEKQAIFETVWKDTFVTDNALVKIVKELRSALGDSADTPHLIETVPKRGYRFIAQVRRTEPAPATQDATESPAAAVIAPESSGGGSSRNVLVSRKDLVLILAGSIIAAVLAGWVLYRQTTTASPQQIQSIAVLPFKPLSAESRDESLEMGMAETLINRLSVVKSLAV